jgi:microcompartment protein CcmK/EutM
MRIATIKGRVTSAIKHASFNGRGLLIAVTDSPDVAPQIVLDTLGAGLGDRVLITSDGGGARSIVGDKSSPARWSVMGIIDPEEAP